MSFSDWISSWTPGWVKQGFQACGRSRCGRVTSKYGPYIAIAAADTIADTVGWAVTADLSKDPESDDYTTRDWYFIPAALFVAIGVGQTLKYYFLDPKDPEKSKAHHIKQSALRAVADGVDAGTFFYAHEGMLALLKHWLEPEDSNYLFLILMFTDAAATAGSDLTTRALINCCAKTGDRLIPQATLTGAISLVYTLVEGLMNRNGKPKAGLLGCAIWGAATVTGTVITVCFTPKDNKVAASLKENPKAGTPSHAVSVDIDSPTSSRSANSSSPNQPLSFFEQSMRVIGYRDTTASRTLSTVRGKRRSAVHAVVAVRRLQSAADQDTQPTAEANAAAGTPAKKLSHRQGDGARRRTPQKNFSEADASRAPGCTS